MQILKMMLFYVLVFLRGPVQGIGHILGVIFLLGGLASIGLHFLTESPTTDGLQLGMIGIGSAFTISVLRHFYDAILVRLNPDVTLARRG